MTGNDGARAVLLPDLDDELTTALGQVEELLMAVQRYEDGDPPPGWPPALAGGAALSAVRRIWDAVAPTQGCRAAEAGRTGRLLAPSGLVNLPGRALRSPGGRQYEHVPLRLSPVSPADTGRLSAAARALGDPHADDNVREALAEGAAAYVPAAAVMAGLRACDPAAEMTATAARVAGLLDLAPDADTALLARIIEAAAPDADIILDQEGEAAYERFARRANAMWGLSDPLSLYLY
jgi:hypothetical protein